MAKKKLKIKAKLPKAGNGLNTPIKDPRTDSYYTPSNSDTRKDYKLNSESKGTKLNPIVKPEVEIIAKRTKPLGWIGQVANSENTNPYLQTGSGQLASDLFVTPITETLHTPSRLLNQAIGLYKGNHPNYDSEIHQTLGLKENDPTDLWQGVRNFTVDNAADIVAPLAPEAGVKFAKNRALNIIGQHPGHARSFSDILEGTLLNNKREYFGNWGVPERDVYGYGKRDLPKLLIHGDESGFVPINYSDPGMNPNYKTYQMNSAVKHGQPLKWQELANEIKGSNPEFEFHQDFTKDPERFKEMMKELAETKGDKGIIKFDVRPNADYKGLRLSNNPIYPEDDVAGHMGFFDTNKMQWNSRDQWGFTPAYDVRYKTTPFQKLQRQAVEKIGKPFNLAQENPIDFSQISRDYQPRIVHNLNVEGEDFWNNLDKWKQKDYTELLKKDYVKSPKFKELYKKDKREFGGNIEVNKVKELDMAKNGKKIKMKLKKADIGKFIPTSDGNTYNEFGVEEEPQSLQEAQYNPTTGQKFDQFNPALTFGLQNYYQSKGKNAPAYLNNQEANQYADYVNTQPKQQNINNNTFASNVAPNLPTQGLFNNFYLNKADHYRKQAINSFSKLGQARYGKQLPKAQFGGNDYANLGSGIANAVTADINTAKGYTDIFGTLNMNSQIAQIEAQNKRQNLVSQFENPTPIFQNGWGGNNALDNGYIPVGEYGTIVKNFESAPKNKHNVEYQGGEGIMIPTENGYVSDYVNSSIKHGDYNSNSASTEGISAALPEGSYVIPGKEISLKEAILPNKKGVLELKQLKTKKAAANVLKPYLDTSMQETLSKDVYSKNSKRLHNQLSQPILTANTEKIEQDKLQGVFGEKVKNSVMKDYEMKYGGIMPETARHGKSLRGTGKDVENNFKNIDEVYKNYKANGYTGAKDITQMREWSYNKDPQGVSAYIERTRPTNEHIRIWKEKYSKTEPVNISKMTPEDRFAGYNDKLWDFRAFKFNDVSAVNNSIKTKPADRDSTIPSTIPSQQAEKLNRLKGFNSNITGLQLPDAYLRDPITVNNLQPEYYQPNTITPYLNDIQRLQYATNTNLGTSGADLASRANSFGQGLTEYGKRYYDASVYNAGVKTQASKDNALTKLNTNQFNNSNYINNARNPQLQRSAVISEQQRLDREAQLKTFADKEHEQNVNNYLQSIYDPNYALNANFSNPYESKSAKQAQEDAKKAEARKILYGEAKYGKKIKLKPKRKK